MKYPLTARAALRRFISIKAGFSKIKRRVIEMFLALRGNFWSKNFIKV
jgi:hypothetical protein